DYRMDLQEKNKLTSPNGYDLIPHEPPELTIDPYLLAGGGTGISIQTSPWPNDEGTMLDAQLTITLPVSLSSLSLWASLKPQHFAGNNDGTLQPGSGPLVYTWSLPPVWYGRYVEAELEGLPDVLTEPMTVTAQLTYSHLGASYVLSGSAPLAINLGGPTVEVDNPRAGAIVTGTTILEGSASDPQPVSKVFVCAKTTRDCIGSDWQLATWQRGGWLYPWTPPADDVYLIQAYGVDAYGLAGPASTPITVSVDSVAPPTPSFDLRNTAYLSTTVMTETLATVSLTGRMSDSVSGGYVSGVDEAVLLINGGNSAPRVEMIPAAQPGQSSSTFSYDMSVPVAAAYGTQTYDLKLGATDRAGNASPVFDTLRIVVDDLPPTVYARVPQVASSSTVTLSGRADDTAQFLLRSLDPPYTASMALANSDSVFVASADASRVLVVGDVNGDTIDDVVLLEPSTVSDPMEAGLFFGQPGGFSAALTMADADVRFQGEAVGVHSFAPAAAGFMDVNGDGVSDLLLGDPHANSNAGRAYLILGRRGGGWVSPFSLADADGQWDVFRAVAFGGSVSAAGDVDGDGLSDFMVGAVHDGDRAGIAYLYLGREQGVPELGATLRSPYATVASPAPPNLAGLGDTDGDGLSDVLIAYPGSGAFTGTVALVRGRSQSEWPVASVDLDTFAEALFTAQGDLQTVSPVGDVNADGLRDFLIGDPNAAQQRVFLLYGRRPENAWPQAPATVDLVTSADASYLESSPGPDVHLGAGLTPMGDLDRDGRSDFAFGNFDASGPIAMPANAAIVRATEMTLSLDMSPWSGSSIVSGSSAGQRAGEYLSSGDVNGDGV
ncbi:MAG: FG-GAP repeat domain-containing protein, partial [Anaerolineae bacterium]